MSTLSNLPATISLIGMPGVGKSTVGVLLAKLIGLHFRDTDIDIQVATGTTLQDIIDNQGHLKLREIEQQVLLSTPLDDSIISTGGSVVYSDTAMQRLRQAGPVVYLQADFEILRARVEATPGRGIAAATDQSFLDVFNERTPLYQYYADHTIVTTDKTPDQVAATIITHLQGKLPRH
ncbi:MAG: shikimate kinase [Halioglobus sp.]